MGILKKLVIFIVIGLCTGCATKIQGKYIYTLPDVTDSNGVDITIEFKRDGNAVITRKYNSNESEERNYPATWKTVDGIIEVWYLTKNPPIFLRRNDDGTLTVLDTDKNEYKNDYKDMFIMRKVN